MALFEERAMVEKPKDEKNIECALCAPFEQTGTWRCADCGAMNINKWKECWKCKAPRLAESGSGFEKPAEKVL